MELIRGQEEEKLTVLISYIDIADPKLICKEKVYVDSVACILTSSALMRETGGSSMPVHVL